MIPNHLLSIIKESEGELVLTKDASGIEILVEEDDHISGESTYTSILLNREDVKKLSKTLRKWLKTNG